MLEIEVPSRRWWKEASVYQIYPASFKDSDGDGLGDIPGVLSKIDYLHDLGIDVVWLSPMFASPQIDMGYDISNFEEVYPPYGTVNDVDLLVEACHKRGMRLILDLVANHTSDQHDWFKESRSSKDNPKRDWYFWRPPRYDAEGNRLPPTNWRSYFAGSTWEWDEHTQEYYLHLYAKEQPDLNWNNEKCRNAIYDSAMRFWLDRGVDGFRVDTVNKYSKPLEFHDAIITDPDHYEQPAAYIFCNGPRIHEFVKEMNEKVLSKYDAMTVGELSLTPDPAHVLRYVGAGAKQLDMVFHIDMGNMDHGGPKDKYDHRPFVLPELKAAITKWQKFIEGSDGWTTSFLENHDNGRSISRYASDEPQFRELSAKMLAMMETTMTGTIFIYQGQEIGMINAPPEWPISDYKDIEALGYYDEARKQSEEAGDSSRLDTVMRGLQILGRDHARLPMQWDSTSNAGFTTSDEPWMRVHDLYPEINVEKQSQDPQQKSVLSFWKQMLRLRKEHRDLFVYGTFDLLNPESETTFSYTKSSGDQKALVVLNFSRSPQPFSFVEDRTAWKLILGTYNSPVTEVLEPFEGRLYMQVPKSML